MHDDEDHAGPSSHSSRNSPALVNSNDRKTEAERRFEEVQRKRVSFDLRYLRIARRDYPCVIVARKGSETGQEDTQRPRSRVQCEAGGAKRAPRYPQGAHAVGAGIPVAVD